MTEQLISFETAKLAKEKGFNEYSKYIYCNHGLCYFDEETLYIYDKDLNYINVIYDCNEKYDIEWIIQAPTQSLLQKWLREVHNIDFVIGTGIYPRISNKWLTVILSPTDEMPIQLKGYKNTYEEALEQGLLEALKLI